jgi:hypothetical protein
MTRVHGNLDRVLTDFSGLHDYHYDKWKWVGGAGLRTRTIGQNPPVVCQTNSMFAQQLRRGRTCVDFAFGLICAEVTLNIAFVDR